MDRWDTLLLVVGAVIAVSTLVRLMRQRRDLLVAQVKQQMAEHRRREAARLKAEQEAEDAA